MTLFNTQYLSWLLRRFAKTAGLWGIVGIAIACVATGVYSAKMSDMREQISSLEASIAQKKASATENVAAVTPAVQAESRQTLSEFYQTFPTALSIPDTLARLNTLAAKQKLVLNSGDYKLHKIASNNSSPKALTQYEMVLPVEGSYINVRAFISSVLSNLPSIAISDIQIERESTLTPSVQARLVLILYVRGDQT